MNDNNLQELSLLRPESAASTLPSPQPNRFANELTRDHSRRIAPCISSPATNQLDRSSPLPARRCERRQRTSGGMDSGAWRMSTELVGSPDETSKTFQLFLAY